MDYRHGLWWTTSTSPSPLSSAWCTRCRLVDAKGVAASLSLAAVLSPVVSLAILMLWQLEGVAKGVHGIVRSWRTSQRANNNDFEARVPGEGIEVGSGVVQRQGHQRC